MPSSSRTTGPNAGQPSTPIDNLPFATITALSQAYRAGTASPAEVTRLMPDRIAQFDGRLHSSLTVTPEIALAQARQAETEIRAGQWRGPMHGVPIGIKDLCNTAGVRTTWGTQIPADHVPTEDATVVRKLLAADAVMLGKLHMTEGAYSVHHPSLPVPTNPWQADHWAGASSSGSGVATAAGLCFGAIGTDTGGSIRFPSGANGITGLKPTWGRVSRHGVWALADSLDHLGPMTRSAADAGAMLGAMLGAMAGVDPLDPTTLEAPVTDYLADIDGGIQGLRVGFDPAFICEVCTPDTAEVIDQARAVLASLGASVVPVSLPGSTRAMYMDWAQLCSVETAIAREATYPARAAQQLDEIFKTPNGINDVLRYTAPFNMSGSPTITLPGGFNAAGTPIGFQLVGRHLDEALLVRVGHAFQQATDWHLRYPAV